MGIAAIAAAIATSAKAYADGAEDDSAETGGDENPKPRRGRPAGSTNKPTESTTTTSGPTDAERFEANRALIKPLVDNNEGEAVKKVIAKYSSSGLKDIPAAKQADFQKDIEALSY